MTGQAGDTGPHSQRQPSQVVSTYYQLHQLATNMKSKNNMCISKRRIIMLISSQHHKDCFC